MKIRTDFVTNSSSSSFICEICGREEVGFDIGLREADMVECVNGHIICEDEMLPMPSKKEMIDIIISNGLNKQRFDYSIREYRDYSVKELKEFDECDLFNEFITCDGTEVPERYCPICQFEEYSERDLCRYLEKEYKVDRADVFAKIKAINKRRRKLYDSEYITDVCTRFNLEPYNVVASWKEKFGTYEKFIDYIGG